VGGDQAALSSGVRLDGVEVVCELALVR